MGTITSDLSTFAKGELDREFRYAMATTGASTHEVQTARVLMDLGVIEAYPANVALALGAAARIEAGALSASHVRRNYGAGGLTYDFVNGCVRAAE